MWAERKTRYASGLILAASLFAYLPSGVLAQAVTSKATAETPAAPVQTDTVRAESKDITSVTIFGAKRKPGDVTQARINPHSASSCNFMNASDPMSEDIMQDYFNSFYGDSRSGQDMNTDQTDPNVAGNTIKDNSPYGNASQGNSANSNTLPGMRVEGLNVAEGGCGPADKAFAAGRNYIARNDHTLKDAFASFDAKDYPQAFRQFQASYDKMGYDQAAFMVGKMYLSGTGTARNTAQGIVWLKKVAEAKFAPKDAMPFNPADPMFMNTRIDATMTLAKVYMVGWDVPKDPKAVRHWYEKAAEYGYIPATHLLGEIYRTGYGVDKNMTKAMSYFKTAGTAGYAPSEYALGVIYYTGEAGVAEDKPLAAGWLVEAAKRGHPGALYAAGRMYDLGETVPEDPQKALVYYKAAAVKGYPDAENALGLFFYTGEIVPKDVDTARKLFEEAAKQGLPDAMFNLAVMYANGEGGPKDMALAYVWMQLAAASGNAQGAAGAAELAPKLTVDEQAKAESLLRPSKP